MQAHIRQKDVSPIQFLRQGTHAGHAALEKTPLARDLLSHDISVARYVEILTIWVSAWTALEDCIGASPFGQSVVALLPPKRAHLGQGDLRYWASQGYTAQRLSVDLDALRQLAPADSASLLGLCYVARGASLGAQVITRHLLQVLPPGAAQGITFFAPDSVPALSWPQWAQALNGYLTTPVTLARAVVSADVAFAALHHAFSSACVTVCESQPSPL